MRTRPLRMRRITWPVSRGQKQLRFWNARPRFAYLLYNFGGSTMKVIKVFLGSGGQIYPFPIDFHRRPYNTTVLACDHSDFYTVSQKTSNFQFLNNSVKS